MGRGLGRAGDVDLHTARSRVPSLDIDKVWHFIVRVFRHKPDTIILFQKGRPS